MANVFCQIHSSIGIGGSREVGTAREYIPECQLSRSNILAIRYLLSIYKFPQQSTEHFGLIEHRIVTGIGQYFESFDIGTDLI